MSLNTKNNSSKDVAQVVAKAIKAWGLPLVVKPSREGSSVGITICKAEEDILPAIELASKSDHTVLIEQFIRGKEVTVSILNNEALIPIEIQPKIDFYNYENKYTEGMTEYFVPARFSKEMLAKCQELALRTAEAVNIRTYGRVDFIITEDEEVYVLEVNTLPGCTETSLLPKAAHFHHITYPQLVLELLKGATLDYEDVK